MDDSAGAASNRTERPVATIRLADLEDIPHLEAIEAEADSLFEDLLGPEPFGPDAATSGSQRAEEPGFLLVLVTGDAPEPIAFAHVLLLDAPGMEGTAHLEQLAVRSAHLRRGYGRALVEASLAEAARRGMSQMTLRTYSEIPWNRPFYEACGFGVLPPSDIPALVEMVRIEEAMGLMRHGPRVLMAREVSDHRASTVLRPHS